MPQKWTFEKCKEIALNYKNKGDFCKNYSGLYNSAQKNGWLDEICSHMEVNGNHFKRLIYAYEFPDNHVYIGLTCNIKNRILGHKIYSSSVYKYIKKTNLIPKIIIHTDLIEEIDAKKMELGILNNYKNNGWVILNRCKTGGLGGNIIKWTKEKCLEEALKYKSRKEYQINSGSAYNTARKYKWLDEICPHMVELKKPNNYWTFDKCKEEALKYKSRTELSDNSSGSYEIACNKGWMDEICSHMIEIKKPRGYWNNKENCKEEALKYKSRKYFSINSYRAYESARKNKWLDVICVHMENPKLKWTKEKCLEIARKCNNKKEFREHSQSSYNSAYINGWLEECCEHMIALIKPPNYWTFEKCKEDALKYKNRTEFQKKSTVAYNKSFKNKWLDIFFIRK